MKKFLYPVRWIGSNYPGANTHYQSVHGYDDLKKSLHWELFKCVRQRAFAYTTRNADIGQAWLGLLVDITKSQIDVIFKSDCYSLRDESSYQLLAREFTDYDYRYSTHTDSDGEQVLRHVKPCSKPDNRISVKPHMTKSHIGYSSYREALGYLKFAGIVIKRNEYSWGSNRNNNVMQERINQAKQWAIEFDIPFLGKIGDFKPSKFFGL